MRRRLADAAEAAALSGLPARLWHYSPTDWPKPDCHPECAFFDAWRAWHEQNPDLETPEGVDIAAWPNQPWHPEWI